MAADETSYWEGRHAAEDSLDSVGWTGLGRAFNGWMYAVRRTVFRRAIRAHVPLGGDARVLDVGSGTGFYLDLWRELGARRVEGSDLSAVAAERLHAARPDTPIHRLDLSGAAEELPDGPYDAVSAMDMLFHIMDSDGYGRAIANLARLVRPGGHLVMSENLLSDRVVTGPVQVSRTEAEIIGLLREHGFAPIARIPMFVLLNGPVDSDSRLLHLWWDLLTRVVSFNEWLGRIGGAVVFPFELAAIRLARRGPSTKLLVCRRVAGR
jgi:SAM-dependent methyltransferase